MSNFLSDFIGGFAGSLKQDLDSQRNAAREDERHARRERARMELEKEYAAEVVVRTAIEGNTEVGYNKYNKPITRRELSPEELAERQTARRTAEAGARRAESEATLGEFGVRDYDEDRRLAREDAESLRRAREAGVEQGWTGLDLRREELSAGRARALEEKARPARQLLYQLGNSGNSSAAAEVRYFEAQLAKAIADNDEAAVNRLLDRILGQYATPLITEEAGARNRGRGGSLSLENVRIPGE